MRIPDFDQIARDATMNFGVRGSIAAVAEALREVWNARGREDLAQLPVTAGPIHSAIRALDQ